MDAGSKAAAVSSPPVEAYKSVERMVKTVRIVVRNVYGQLVCYPACERADLFAEIAGTRTLSHRTLALAERLGYTIHNDTPVIDWRKAR